ncbi:hypothetical protein [Peterkaempfera griseoplana]|nr:hypothetical protein [Peterkaempfera griseoplana]
MERQDCVAVRAADQRRRSLGLPTWTTWDAAPAEPERLPGGRVGADGPVT